jgi:hypothetical protein
MLKRKRRPPQRRHLPPALLPAAASERVTEGEASRFPASQRAFRSTRSRPITGSPSIDVNMTLDLTTGMITRFHRTYELGDPGQDDLRNEQTGTGVLDCAATAECMNDAAHCSQ